MSQPRQRRKSSGDALVEAALDYADRGLPVISIAIENLAAAREESYSTTSLLEFNKERDGDPWFVNAAALAGSHAGLEGKPLEDSLTRSTWLVIPGVGDVEAFEELMVISLRDIYGWFVAEVPELDDSGITDEMLRSSWLFGYFLRAQEQYAPVDGLFDEVEDWLESEA